MAKSPAEVIAMIDARFGERLHPPEAAGVDAVRAAVLRDIRDFLAREGFPQTRDDRYSLSLIPFIFQEANYDDIDWGPECDDLGSLQDWFDVDFHVAFAGRERDEVGIEERQAYFQDCHAFIRKRQKS